MLDTPLPPPNANDQQHVDRPDGCDHPSARAPDRGNPRVSSRSALGGRFNIGQIRSFLGPFSVFCRRTRLKNIDIDRMRKLE